MPSRGARGSGRRRDGRAPRRRPPPRPSTPPSPLGRRRGRGGSSGRGPRRRTGRGRSRGAPRSWRARASRRAASRRAPGARADLEAGVAGRRRAGAARESRLREVAELGLPRERKLHEEAPRAVGADFPAPPLELQRVEERGPARQLGRVALAGGRDRLRQVDEVPLALGCVRVGKGLQAETGLRGRDRHRLEEAASERRGEAAGRRLPAGRRDAATVRRPSRRRGAARGLAFPDLDELPVLLAKDADEDAALRPLEPLGVEELPPEVAVPAERGEVEARGDEPGEERLVALLRRGPVEGEEEGALAGREQERAVDARPGEADAPVERLLVPGAARDEGVGNAVPRARLARGERDGKLRQRRPHREHRLEVARREEGEADRGGLHRRDLGPRERQVRGEQAPLLVELPADAGLPEPFRHRVLRVRGPGERLPDAPGEGTVERGGIGRDEDDGRLGEREDLRGGGERRRGREEKGERLHGTSSALRTRE